MAAKKTPKTKVIEEAIGPDMPAGGASGADAAEDLEITKEHEAVEESKPVGQKAQEEIRRRMYEEPESAEELRRRTDKE